MVTEQASEHNLSDLSGEHSVVSTERLLNLLELANSDLTASTGMEELPISEMLLDTLLGVLHSECPELLAHSQRVAFVCYGMGRQFGWSAKRTNTLVTAALLHELGMLANPQQHSFWDEPASEEELSRFVSIDLLEACHADSDVLEILSLSLNFRYREPQPAESDSPTPDHVLLGAAAFQFAHLFEKVRHQKGGAHRLSEIVAALQSVAEVPIEEQVVAALEEWLAGRDKIIHSFDPSMFFPNGQNLDAETAAFVRGTFIEILEELFKLQKNYDAFFVLDSTGRFQLWNSGCQLHHGYTIREMRNKHWHNSLIGYSNQEGLAFSDAQTPLFQTLESGKASHTTLFLKQGEHNFVEAKVDSVPIMGRDKLMLGIVELHCILDAPDLSSPEILFTPEWISELAGELRRLDQEEPEAQAIPNLDDELISIIESRLGIASQLPADSATVSAPDSDLKGQSEQDSSAHIDLDEVDSDVQAEDVLDPAESDILTEEQIARADAPVLDEIKLSESETTLGSVESDTVASEEPEHAASLESDTSLSRDAESEDELSEIVPGLVLDEEDSSDEELPELGSHLDNLLSRFDTIASDSDESEDIEVASVADDLEDATPPDATIDEDRDEPMAVSGGVEFEAADLETESVEHHAAAESDEIELSPEEEDPEAVTSSVSDEDVSDHVLDSSLELADRAEAVEPVLEDSESVIDEDDVLSFLAEESAVDAEETPALAEQTAEEVGVSEAEETAPEQSSSVAEDEDVESDESMDASSVLESEEEADFGLNSDVQVTDSELLQALQNGDLDAEYEAEEEDSLEESSDAVLEEPVAEQFEEVTEEAVAESVTEEPVVEQVEEVAAEPVFEQAEELFEEPVAEQIEDVVEETVAEEAIAESVTEEPAAEQADEVVEESVVEPIEEVSEDPVVEQAEELSEESVAEQIEEVTEEPVVEEPIAEQVEEETSEPEPEPVVAEEPVSDVELESPPLMEEEEAEEPEPIPVSTTSQAELQESLGEPDEFDPQAAPVSRSEWDAFVSYLLDPNSADHEEVSVLFLDLDRFKAINEGFGRQIGDDLLKEISRRLSEACGKRELSCRYGGGQFAIGCPGLSLEKASKRGDQIRKLIERTRFDVLPFQALTASIGVASSEQGDTLDELMNRAEHSLYNAKLSGRNCVVGLSSREIEEEQAQEEEEIATVGDKEFEVVSEFEAMIASDMIVYKLGGFLYDMHAKLLHVDKRHVFMRVGSKGFLPYWGRQDDARPVLIDLELGEGWEDQKEGLKPTKSSVIHIRIRPDGWVRNQETFVKRAQHVLRELKGYFAGS